MAPQSLADVFVSQFNGAQRLEGRVGLLHGLWENCDLQFYKSKKKRVSTQSNSSEKIPWKDLVGSGALDIIVDTLHSEPHPDDPFYRWMAFYMEDVEILAGLLHPRMPDLATDSKLYGRLQSTGPILFGKICWLVCVLREHGDDATSKKVARTGFLAIGVLFRIFGRQRGFVSTFEESVLVDLTYFAVFVSPPPSLAAEISLLQQAVSVFGAFKDVPFAATFLEHNKVPKIVKRFNRWYDIGALDTPKSLIGAFLLLLGVVADERVQKSLHQPRNMYSALVRACWVCIKAHDHEPGIRGILIYDAIVNLARICRILSIPIRNAVVGELVRQESLIQLMSQAFLWRPINGSVAAIRDYGPILCDYIKSASTCDPTLISDWIAPEWLYVHDSLVRLRRQLSADIKDFSAQMWCEYGFRMGNLDVCATRRDISTEAGPQICSWFKCLLHDEPRFHEYEMLGCTGCGTTRYCSTACQRRDWREGGHDQQCQKQMVVPRLAG